MDTIGCTEGTVGRFFISHRINSLKNKYFCRVFGNVLRDGLQNCARLRNLLNR